jgi:hypothetical protein
MIPVSASCRADGSSHPQHPFFRATAAVGADAEPQPHPAPPPDFTSASRAQHASAPVGAGPPQQALGAACDDDVKSSEAPGIVCVREVSAMMVSLDCRRSRSSLYSGDAPDWRRTQRHG